MPCPEKFRDSLAAFHVDEPIQRDILDGYENLVSSSPKIQKAAFFKRAVDIMDERMPPETVRDVLAWSACCKSGAREKASREFARINADLPISERLMKIRRAPYLSMGSPELESDDILRVDAVSFVYEGRYACACSNYRRVKYAQPVSKHYCYCCGGHFQYHYQIMLGKTLELTEVVSSPLDSEGRNPCVFRFRMV